MAFVVADRDIPSQRGEYLRISKVSVPTLRHRNSEIAKFIEFEKQAGLTISTISQEEFTFLSIYALPSFDE
jgi:hypothetical protein